MSSGLPSTAIAASCQACEPAHFLLQSAARVLTDSKPSGASSQLHSMMVNMIWETDRQFAGNSDAGQLPDGRPALTRSVAVALRSSGANGCTIIGGWAWKLVESISI